MNVDSQGERYYIEGLKVTRMDARGSRDFSIYWDEYKQQWQWGMHGRLALQWLADDMIAWVPESPEAQCYGKVWRWQRCGPAPPTPPPPQRHNVSSDLDGGGYGPVRTSRACGGPPRHDAQPYPTQQWRRYGEESPEQRRSYSSDRQRREQENRDYRSSRHYRDRRDHRDHRDHRDRREYRQRWSHSAISGHATERLACGLTVGEVCSLLTREIRPEDYDLLLRLDETVKKPTASAESVEGLPEVSCKDFMGEDCTVCLSAFVSDDSVVALPCRHHFHSACIKKWLTECRHNCPLCGVSFGA